MVWLEKMGRWEDGGKGEREREQTLKSSSISSTLTPSTSLGLIRAALKKTTSTGAFCVRASSCARTAGREDRSARSRSRVETLTVGEALATKGASEFWRCCVLRARRMMCCMPLEANAAAVC